MKRFARRALESVKRRFSLQARRRLAFARISVRKLTARSRLLPDFLVVGTQRGGTSSLYKYLGMHPEIVPSLRKETSYFGHLYREGDDWYRAHFPLALRRRAWRALGRRLLSFEATPDYLLHPLAAERAARTVPDAKIVVLLRDPVDRAFSQYKHNVRHGRERRSFETALEREPDRIRAELSLLAADPEYPAEGLRWNSYLTRGRYVDHLQRWLEHYARDQILVLSSEEFFTDTAQVYLRILDFLGVRPFQPSQFDNFSATALVAATSDSALPDDLRARLADEMRPFNERLYALVGRDFGWS